MTGMNSVAVFFSLAMLEDIGDIFLIDEGSKKEETPRLVCPSANDGSYCLNYALASGCRAKAKDFPQCSDCSVPTDKFKTLI